MFGYVESPYTVEKAVQVAHGDRRIEIGLRASKLNGAERYIALEVFAADGMQLKDILLTYDGAAVAHLEPDWVRLIEDPALDLKSLNYTKMVVGHHTGYSRDGGVCMY